MSIRTLLSIILLCTATVATDAQSVTTDSVDSDTIVAPKNKESLSKRVNTKLATSYYKLSYDSAYVVRPQQRWLLRLMGNVSGDYIHAKGTINDVYSKYDLHTHTYSDICLEVNYYNIGASISINPAQLSGSYKDFEFNLDFHGDRFSLDFSYERSTSLKGDMRLGNIDHLDEDGLRMNVFNLTGYYVFNHRHFSLPAAFSQNYFQLRSAGSWLAGLGVQAGSIRTTDDLIERSPQAPDVHLRFANVSLGAGYGYNFVFGHRAQWLLHLSFLPTFVVYKHNTLEVRSAADRTQGYDYQEKRDHGLCFNMIFNERASLVYYFSPKYFVGTSFMMSNSIYDNDKVTVNQNKWLARAFFGVRF